MIGNLNKNKRTLIIGAGGALGSYLMRFSPCKDRFIGLKRNQCEDDLYEGSVIVDLADADMVKEIFKSIQVDQIVYTAGFWDGLNDSSLTFFKNLVPLFNLLNVIGEQVNTFIFMSSSAIYSNDTDPVNPTLISPPASSYGQAKLIGEQLLWHKFKGSNTNCVILRPFHICIPTEPYQQGRSHILTNLFHKLAIEGRQMNLSELSRDIYVPLYWAGDLCEVITSILEKRQNQAYQVINVGNQKEFSILEIGTSMAHYLESIGLYVYPLEGFRPPGGRLSKNSLSALNLKGVAASRELGDIIKKFVDFRRELQWN